ncbi:MAG: HlyD family efflux transporter periplasmic adaptor subunit [Pirellulaceae bacterium]|nr:HlyD family efflux transporter periplasmic adaptor subunit [Pirellulaceae bacterium]
MDPTTQPASGAPDPIGNDGQNPPPQPKQTPRRRDASAVRRNTSIEPSSVDTAALHSELHHATLLRADEATIYEAIRRIVMKYTAAIGVGRITADGKNSDGSYNWDLKPENTTGRLPRRHDFIEKFAESCNTTIQRHSIQMEHFLGVQAIYSPIESNAGDPEVLLVLTDDSNTTGAVFVLEIANAYITLFLRSSRGRNNDWKLVSLAALIELISQIESQPTLALGCEVVANELVRHLGAKQVAVGYLHDGQMVVESLSGTVKLDPASETYHGLEMALSESVLRDSVAIYPPRPDDETHLLVAHRQLCGDLQIPAVMSSPLTTPDGKTIGAILLTGTKEQIHGDRLPNFIRASGPRLASALEVVSRAQIGRIRQISNSIRTAVPSIRGFTWGLIALCLAAVMLMPVRYRVRCNCTTEPTVRRFAVAPFQGLIEKGFAKPGDAVSKGQLLARMDGKSIRWELASVLAEQQQAAKKREIELANRNVTASLLSQLESDRLIARTRLLQHQQQQVEIRSPIDGVILSGTLERAEAAAVDTGEVVYEIAPLDQMRIEVTIPAQEITHVTVGQDARIWIDGMSGQSFVGRIERVNPRSELREGRNVFVATVTLPNDNDLLRPGMTGSVRIDGARHPLVWNILHRPWDYLASRLTWW